MGGAMLSRWADKNVAPHYLVISPSKLAEQFQGNSQIRHVTAPDQAAADLQSTNAIVLAVKPQIMKDVCMGLKDFVDPDTLILSVAAGVQTDTLQGYFSPAQPVVRAMPNTPAAIGKGMTAAFANANVSEDQREMADSLLRSVGDVEWIENEDWLYAITATSGSGPAYVFLLVEALAEAAREQGLDEKLAMALARKTIIGSAALLEANPHTPASTMRENVTSPNGTTAAALKILMGEDGLQALMDEAIKAATKRGRELGAAIPVLK